MFICCNVHFLLVAFSVWPALFEANGTNHLHGRRACGSVSLWNPCRQVKPITYNKLNVYYFDSSLKRKEKSSLPSSMSNKQFGKSNNVSPVALLSSRYGRRILLLVSYLLIAVCGTCAAFSPSFPLFCFFRFGCGMALSGIALNSFSLSMIFSSFILLN